MNATPTQSSLSDSQRAALAARLRRGRDAAPGAIPRRAPGRSELPLSFAQEQLWFIDQFHNLPTYNIPGLLRLRGPLDAAALGRAIDQLIARHETLRTRLVANTDGRPIQLIDAAGASELAQLDLSAVPGDQVEQRLREFAVEQALQPFDLAAGPLFRRTLIRLSATEHALLIVLHHTIFDGWSFGVLLRELAACYTEQVTGVPAGLAELPVQYADYALWEQDRLSGPELAELAEYWKANLDGLETVQLPTDRPRPIAADHSGGIEHGHFGSTLLQGLRELAKQQGTTPFVVLMATLQALL
ncbi:MAG: condensation domain-containing protein, partial [Jatrophihabitantaceae bacterium]